MNPDPGQRASIKLLSRGTLLVGASDTLKMSLLPNKVELDWRRQIVLSQTEVDGIAQFLLCDIAGR